MNRRSFVTALGVVALSVPGGAPRAAESFEVRAMRLVLDGTGDDDPVLLDADFTVGLTRTLEDAVERGLPLYFEAEFRIDEPRWYWLDRNVLEAVHEWRLSYHALTRQYRVATREGSQVFSSLEDAVASMSHIRRWQIGHQGQLQPGGRYAVWLRMQLDASRLPKPFQMTAITNRDWNPQSEWKRTEFSVPIRKSDP